MNKEDKFIEIYNQLDTYLRIKYFNDNPSYTSYSKKIFYIKNHKLEPIIQNEHYFDILKKAGEIRNIVAHNNNIIVPSDEFLNEFSNLVDRICKAKRVDQIMTPYSHLQTKDYQDRLKDVIELIANKGYNAIPIINNHQFVGMFTEKTIFDYLSISERIIDKEMFIKEMHEVIDLDGKPRAYFKFIPRNLSVDQAYDIFTQDFKGKHQLLLLLVTENGIKTEKLLGIVALRDLKNELY